MTVFDIMPSLWLICAFLMLLFYLLLDIDLAAYTMSSCLLCLASSLLTLPIRVQSGVFFSSLLLFIAADIISNHRKEQTVMALAVTDITSDGGYVRINGQIVKAYSRDRFIRYRAGEVFTLKKHGKNNFLIC